jgi:hypothetical protein
MYLWKYWRESRILFGMSMLGIAVLAWLVLKGTWHISLGQSDSGMPDPRRDIPKILMASLYLQVPVSAFLAWVMGSFGVGRNLGEDSGSYLLTRPRRRYWFLWRDWGFGFLQLVFVIVLANLLIGYLVHRLLGAGGGPLNGSVMLRDVVSPVPLAVVTGLNCLAMIAFAGLIFGITYFSTICMKHARGVMLGAGIVLGYLILSAVVRHYWPAIELPNLLMRVFQTSPVSNEPVNLSEHAGLTLAVRAVVMMLFPVGAQMILERSEI